MRACELVHALMGGRQIGRIDPSAYRILTDLVNTETKGKGRVESMGSAGT